MIKNELKLAIVVVLIAITAVAGFGEYGLYAGNPRVVGLYIEDISVTNNLVELKVGSAGSADNYKDYKYSIKGKDLYITVNYALRTENHKGGNFNIQIKDDFRKVRRVYLTGGGDRKQIWGEGMPTEEPKGSTATIINLPADQIVSGEVVQRRIGGTLRYQFNSDELKAFIDFFNNRRYTDSSKEEFSSDHTALSDSTDVILQLPDGKTIYIMVYVDGETVITDQNGNSFLIIDQNLTDYLTEALSGCLR